jgi:hypothetical protein
MAVFAGLDVASGDAEPGGQNKGEKGQLAHTSSRRSKGSIRSNGWVSERVPEVRGGHGAILLRMPSAVAETDGPSPQRIESSQRFTVAVAAALLIAAWLLAYGPTIAGGFIKDDFAWVYHGHLNGWSAFSPMRASPGGFYRPVVQLTFSATEAVFGTNPIPYALTNLLLGLGCAASLFALARALGLAAWAALAATAVWAFNFHGINMALLWFSGRTSLLGTLFSTLAALALTRRRDALAGVLALLALLAKEEVVALPLILTLWLLMSGASVKRSLGLWIALAVYFGLREYAGAVGISNAPMYYRFNFDLGHVATNIVEYADRSMTLGVLLLVATMVALKRVAAPSPLEWRLVWMGSVWLAGGFAATIWLPVRSSLYAVFPSAGLALAVGALLTATVRRAEPRRAWRVAVAGVILPFLLLPIYWQRNVRWTELRDLSAATIAAIRADTVPGQRLVVLEDDLSTRANFRHVFGGQLPDAAAWLFDDVALWIEPPPPEIDAAAKPAPTGRIVTFRLVNGRVELTRPAARAND